jgi:hypothetical protein
MEIIKLTYASLAYAFIRKGTIKATEQPLKISLYLDNFWPILRVCDLEVPSACFKQLWCTPLPTGQQHTHTGHQQNDGWMKRPHCLVWFLISMKQNETKSLFSGSLRVELCGWYFLRCPCIACSDKIGRK